MMKLFKTLTIGGALLACGAALAGEKKSDGGPDPRIGEEVSRICFANTISGWRALKGEDNAVLLEKGVNDWYRVELTGVCRGGDLRFAETIGIDSRPAGGCVTRGDAILVKAPGGFVNRCHIARMYEWNDKPPAAEEPDDADEDYDDEDVDDEA